MNYFNPSEAINTKTNALQLNICMFLLTGSQRGRESTMSWDVFQIQSSNTISTRSFSHRFHKTGNVTSVILHILRFREWRPDLATPNTNIRNKHTFYVTHPFANLSVIIHKNETHSHNHYCCGQAISVTYPECISVALVIEHAKHICTSILPSVAYRGF